MQAQNRKKKYIEKYKEKIQKTTDKSVRMNLYHNHHIVDTMDSIITIIHIMQVHIQ